MTEEEPINKPVKEQPEKPVEKPPERDMIKEANEAASRLEAANTRHNDLLDREERLKVQERLGGTTEAGQPAKSKEDKEKEDANKLLEGTGFEI